LNRNHFVYKNTNPIWSSQSTSVMIFDIWWII